MIARVVAPSALRTPISRVRSRTAISMMFITPMPPSASVMKPTASEEVAHRVDHAAEHQRADRRVPHPHRFTVVRVEVVPAREHGAHVALERPVDVLDAAGPLAQLPRQVVDDRLLRRHDDVRDGAGLARRGGESPCAIAANGTKILSLSGPL